jgi:uncharacterized membrane protein
MEINNKARFWAGIGLFGSEMLGGLIFVTTLIKWTWLTQRVLLISLGAIFFLLFNGLATILVWNGSKKEKVTSNKKK